MLSYSIGCPEDNIKGGATPKNTPLIDSDGSLIDFELTIEQRSVKENYNLVVKFVQLNTNKIALIVS